MRSAWILIALAACSNELGGDLSLDGTPFSPSSCRSGAVYGFRGVTLRGAGGELRIASTMTGEARVALFPAGAKAEAQAALDLGACGLFTISDQSSTINDVKNVEGKAQLECTAHGHTVKGTVTFSNCH